MIMCVLLCYPVSIHMSQLLSTGRPICSCFSFLKEGHNATLYKLFLMMKLIFIQTNNHIFSTYIVFEC